ncbi:MAG: protein kinase [Bryobacteraceae bacterium]|nr:protein kinase [Bryobacteraceae bacterium]
MPLAPGSRLGPYEIASPLGAGGMGEVWRARDSKLNRDVAIKVLPASLAGDARSMTRFEREAQLLAALNHPNIAALYGLEDSGAQPALVMELVEGETLADRIRRGPVAVAEAVAIARQICDALEAAHAKGIIHRDLKPANVKLTPEGQVKVLDFGLAKALEPEAGVSAAAAGTGHDSPTLSLAATRAGVILGTAGYMSPEQARGVPADKRSDIWAFGVLLYELLTGRLTFAGETVADTLAAVLKTDPDFAALPADTPAPLRRLLRRCLQRDRKKRLHDIADARLELELEPEPLLPAGADAAARRAWRTIVPWAVAGALALAIPVLLWFNRPRGTTDPLAVRFELLPPEGMRFTDAGHSVSPDGRLLLIHAMLDGSTETSLYLRALNAPNYRLLPGATNGRYAEFSADSRRFVFLSADNKVKRFELETGTASTVCAGAASVRGFSWSSRDVILIGSNAGPIVSVPAAGGTPSPVTQLDTAAGETGHGFPGFLPDGRFFLYSAFRPGQADIVLADLERKSAPKRLLTIQGGKALFASDADLSRALILYRAENTLQAVGFDARRHVVTSAPFTLIENLVLAQRGQLPAYASTPAKVMMVNARLAESAPTELALLNRKGERLAILSRQNEPNWGHPEFSADDRLLLGDRAGADDRGSRDLWTLDLTRNVATRITFGPGSESTGIFAPDGRRVYFTGSSRGGASGIFSAPADGSGEPVLVRKGNFHHLGISPDGKQIAFEVGGPGSANEIGLLTLAQPDRAETLIGGVFWKSWPQFSPNGKWLAFASQETSRVEIYVQSHPPGNGKWRVTSNGGSLARWRRDGKELVIHEGNGRFVSVEVRERNGSLEFGAPQPLFEANINTYATAQYWAMTGDAQRFALHVAPEVMKGAVQRPPSMSVLLDWLPGVNR